MRVALCLLAVVLAQELDVGRRAEIVKPRPGEYKWRQIPWLLDLGEGIRLAREEKRPLLLWVSGDDPLERC